MRKKTETTKILLVISWTVTIPLTVLTVLFPVWGLPTDGLQIVTPLAWAEVATVTGFYIWKAKNENRAKYAQKFITYIANKYGIEAAVQVAEIVLKD